MSVLIVAQEFAKRGGWKYDLYDSDLPISEDNKPSPVEESTLFGSPNHTVTFFDKNGRNETVIAGLLVMYPDMAWTELSKKLQTGAEPPSLVVPPPVTAKDDPNPPGVFGR
jgi:hypothetical protein